MVFVSQMRGKPKRTWDSLCYPAPTTPDDSTTPAPYTEPFPLFFLPVEIQLIIYRFAWTTGPVEEHPYTFLTDDLLYFVRRTKKSNDLIQIELSDKIQEEFSTVCAMGATCRHMRHVVYDEYFSRTQAVSQFNIISFQHTSIDTGLNAMNHNVRPVIEGSIFLSEHARHACLVINDVHVKFDEGLEDHRLKWLMGLKKLTTLEVVFEQQQYTGWRNKTWWWKGHPGLEAAKLGLQSLPRLEKLVLRLKWSHSQPQKEAISWDDVPWFQELRDVFLENVAVSEVRCSPPVLYVPPRLEFNVNGR